MAGKLLLLGCCCGTGCCINTLYREGNLLYFTVFQTGIVDTRNTPIAVSGCAAAFLYGAGKITAFDNGICVRCTVLAGDAAQILITAEIRKAQTCRQLPDSSVIASGCAPYRKLLRGAVNSRHISQRKIRIRSGGNSSVICTCNAAKNGCLSGKCHISCRRTVLNGSFIDCAYCADFCNTAAADSDNTVCCTGYLTFIDSSQIFRCNTSRITVTAGDTSMVLTIGNQLSCSVLSYNSSRRTRIRADTLRTVLCIVNIAGGRSRDSSCRTQGCPDKLCLTDQINPCCIILSQCTLIDADNTADLLLSPDSHSTADCSQLLCAACAVRQLYGSGSFIQSCDTADSHSASAVNGTCLSSFILPHEDAAAVTPADSAHIAS